METWTLSIRTLLCERDVPMALKCLGSYFQNNQDTGQRLVIHDDGSLSEESRHQLQDVLPVERIITHSESDAFLRKTLGDLPQLAKWRIEKPTMMKIIDCVAWEKAAGNKDGYLRFLDSDIPFLRPFCGLFRWNPGHDALFMTDVRQSYSIPLGQAKHLFPLVSRLNCGIIEADTKFIDLGTLEGYLGIAELTSHPVRVSLLEQTLWAILTSKIKVKQVDPRQIALVQPNTRQSRRHIAAHFVTGTRHLMDSWQQSDRPPEVIKTRPAHLCGNVRYTLEETYFRYNQVIRSRLLYERRPV